MAYIIFDLDGTVVDTSHRYRDLPCGKIDLDFWFDNSTPEMIARDSLLPLAATMRRCYETGNKVVVCTARSFENHPRMTMTECVGDVYRKFLADNNLPYHALLHRLMAGPDHASMNDGDLKVKLLTDYALSEGLTCMEDLNAIMFDDNVTVIRTLAARKVRMIDAIEENKRLTINRRMRMVAAA